MTWTKMIGVFEMHSFAAAYNFFYFYFIYEDK